MARLDQALTYINKASSLGGFGQSFVAGAGGLVLAFFSIIIGLGEALANMFTNPIDAFGKATSMVIMAVFGGPARFMRSAWNTAAVQLGMSPWNTLGPFVTIVAGASVVGTVAVFAWYVDAINSDTLTGLTIPLVNRDQGGDTDDEQ